MSKLALLLAIPATAGLVVWNLSLTSELAEMRERLDAAGPPGEIVRQTDTGRGAPAAAEARTTREAARANQQVADLTARLAQVEARLPVPPAAPAPGDAETEAPAPVVPSDVVATFGSEAFKGAVEKVLEDRDLARRKERMQNGAEARAKFLLRDLTVTDQQRADVQRVIFGTMERREQIRNDESIHDDQRRTDIQALQAQEIESIAALLDAQSAETVRQRATGGPLNRLRQGDGNARTPNGTRNGARQK